MAVIRKRTEEAMTLVEIAIATTLLGLVAATALATLLYLNKNAVSTRAMGNAREIVQRNIESAVGAPFTAVNIPPVLAVTAATVWNDGGPGNQVNVYSNRDGSGAVLGTLRRTVATLPPAQNPAGANVRRVTFRLDYSLFGRPMAYEMTTIRAMDR